MSVNKMHRLILVGTAVILAFVLSLSPSKLVAPLSQQVGLTWLPLLFPLLVLSLELNLARSAREDITTLTASWSGILRWAILLPLVSSSFPTALLALAGGLFWAWLAPISFFSTVFSTMDEPWVEQLLKLETTAPAPFAFSIIAATWSRLVGLSFIPVIGGLALAAGTGRPLWAAGIAALVAQVCRVYFDLGGSPGLEATIRSYHLVWFSLPILCWLCKLGWRHFTSPQQLSLDFGQKRDKTRGAMLVLLVTVLLAVYAGRDMGYFMAISGIAMFYTLLARSTIGLLLFPIWSLLELVPKQAWPSCAVGLLSGVIAAVLAGQIWTARRSSSELRPSFVWSVTIGVLTVGLLFISGQLLISELAGFPSASGDWLAWLSASEFSSVWWIFFVICTSLGILSEQKIYIYLAWGIFLPVEWGISLIIGSGLATVFARQTGRLRSVGKGLIVGDLMASLLLLLS